MEIRFCEGLVAGIGEMMIALRKCALDAGESARETQAVRLEAEKMRELLRARRESAEHMVASCREKLVSVNNILEYENDRTEYWRGIKERIEKFLTIANEYMPVTEKACAYMDGACEKLAEAELATLRRAEDFLRCAEAGGGGLIRTQTAVSVYAGLPTLGERR